MAKLNLTVNGEDKSIETEDFNDTQKRLYAEASAAEQELTRYKYLVAIFSDRKDFLLGKIVEYADPPKPKKKNAKKKA